MSMRDTSGALKSAVVIAAVLVAAVAAQAQMPARGRMAKGARPAVFFPLAVGNTWVYLQRGTFAGGRVEVTVSEVREFNGSEYFRLVGYAGRAAWVRSTDDDRLIEFNPETSTESLWYDFGAGLDEPWRSELPLDCTGEARIVGKPAVGNLRYVSDTEFLTVQYGPTECADAGVTEEAFLPGVGLSRRTFLTIAGPQDLTLVYAKVGSRVIGASQLLVSLSIDAPVYVANLLPPVDPERAVPTLAATLTIRNTTDHPLQIVTPSGQQYDFSITDQNGQVVHQWSARRLFTQATTTIEVSPGERSFTVEIPLGNDKGQPFPAGAYSIEGWITGSGSKRYGAVAGFDVAHVF
ncbi:MAG: BsuPI-related putative proteinase inhibitor [Acidobacteria bacterium]|nr:BsuPI-related putative proteinase inhibitor [Acidobacteriota bacterium]